MSREIRPGEGLRDQAAHLLAVCAAAGPWRQPAHDLAEVTCRGRAGRGDSLVDKGLDLLFRQRLRQVVREDRDLRLFLGREILPTALAERLDGLTPRLHLAGEDRGVVVVAELALLPFLDVVGGVL